MATYIVLANFTDQGARNVKDTTKRAALVKEAAKTYGIEMKDIYWTLGMYDVVVTFEAPDDESMTALGLTLAAAGNVRTQTLKAFSMAEMNTIIGKAGL
ncbi:GYD domain-containing protein [Crenobacter cavernae]|uniref:GYD domain-containing protein n=1 Tax=Crenobacter cavernae TaxID=2290923 RepID=A0A345Y7H1_9NEIS|nr:GYD domain-containing protein [Crenobacter cavernae]AXK39873.1 GYD domain-containing protein [Crenobacter cavernae]